MANKKKTTKVASRPTPAIGNTKRARSPDATLAPIAKRVKTTQTSQAASGSNQGVPPPPTFAGNFDLYSHRIDALSDIYASGKASAPPYDALYKRILSFQAEPDRTAQIYLAMESHEPSSLYGCLHDPLADEPLDNIGLGSITIQQSLSLPKGENSYTSSTPRPGVVAKLKLNGGHSGMRSLTGTLRMSRLWTKPTSGGNHVELFEGHITYDLRYSGLFSGKGVGSGQKDSWSFWAVRAKVGTDGFEVGVKKRVKPVIVNPDAPLPAASSSALKEATSTRAVTTSSKKRSPHAAPEFDGTFKFYSVMDLTEHGLETDPFPSYKQIYEYISENKPDVDLKCKFAPGVAKDNDLDDGLDDDLNDDFESDIEDTRGRIRGKSLVDPLVERPFQFDILSIEPERSLSFTGEELGVFPLRDDDPTGPGATIKLRLADTHRYPEVYDGTGSIKIIRAWAGRVKGKLLEVFEAYLEYDLDVNPKAYRQATGEYTGKHLDANGFWVIKANGDEIESDESEDEEGCGGYY